MQTVGQFGYSNGIMSIKPCEKYNYLREIVYICRKFSKLVKSNLYLNLKLK